MAAKRYGRELAKWFAVVAAVLGLYVGLYVGAYYATVTPTAVGLEITPGDPGVPYVMDFYRIPIDPGMAETFFAPIHWFDRRIRPHVWEPESE